MVSKHTFCSSEENEQRLEETNVQLIRPSKTASAENKAISCKPSFITNWGGWLRSSGCGSRQKGISWNRYVFLLSTKIAIVMLLFATSDRAKKNKLVKKTFLEKEGHHANRTACFL
jgi:hypothetical protein